MRSDVARGNGSYLGTVTSLSQPDQSGVFVYLSNLCLSFVFSNKHCFHKRHLIILTTFVNSNARKIKQCDVCGMECVNLIKMITDWNPVGKRTEGRPRNRWRN